MKRFSGIAVFMLAMVAIAIGQSTTWRADKAHSKFLFSVRHMVISEVIGYFKEWDMKVTVSKEDWTDAVAEAKARDHVIPGVILQPSGVFAVLRAQELGCGYILAS